MAGIPPEPRRDPAGAETPRPSYYVRNPWRNVGAGAFAGASTVLSVTTLFYALGRLPLVLVGASLVVAALAFGFGLYARRTRGHRHVRHIAPAGLRRPHPAPGPHPGHGHRQRHPEIGRAHV